MIIDSSTIPGTVIGRFGPWCEVKWDVGMPYNRTMPQECPNNWLWIIGMLLVLLLWLLHKQWLIFNLI